MLPPSSPSPRLLTVKELAVLLRCSKTSIYRLVECRLIPFYRLRGRLAFSEDDVREYVDGRRVETAEHHATL